ncbi:MAG: YciI family protein [Roseiflexaceae bacterium]
MKYVFLAYGDERQLDAMSSSEREALGNACLANDEVLRKSGHLLAVEGLQSSRTATTVRVQHGTLSVTDGPFAETKEQLIGIFTIDARDLNEAIQVAAKMPQARGGPIEVRPIMAVDQP